MMKKKSLIGIVGGMGPAAGLDCAEKIVDQTNADQDQDHIPLAVLSCPQLIGDRTAYLLDPKSENPAYAIVEVIEKLKSMGAEVIGIPCNTAHVSSIFAVIIDTLKKKSVSVKIVNMIDETVDFISTHLPHIDSLGLLATKGTYESEVYRKALEPRGYRLILPNGQQREKVHRTIYDKKRGIKAHSKLITAWAVDRISASVKSLYSQGAEYIIMGCTEISLVIPQIKPYSDYLIDPTKILARALIRETYPEKLKDLRI